MPEPTTIIFSYQEHATLMIRALGIKEGHWGVFVRFGINGTNLETPGKDGPRFTPAAIVPIGEFGLQRFDNPLEGFTADAATVWKDETKTEEERFAEKIMSSTT